MTGAESGQVPKRMPQTVAEPPPRPDAPKRFIDHEQVVEYFKGVGRDGLAHAYIFYGPRGVGKKTFARALAFSLLCEDAESFPVGYCGECGACKRGIAGSSGDIIIVDEEFVHAADAFAGKPERKTSDIGIEASRRIIQLMSLKSYEGSSRLIAILPDFDNVTSDATYNALLKELEEPNPGKLFLITTEHLDSIIETIRSRAVLVRFDPMPDATIERELVNEYKVPKARATEIARRAQGSLGEAILELDEESAELRRSAREWLLACLRAPGKLPPMPEFDKDERENARAELDEVLRQARLTARDVLVSALGNNKVLLDPTGAAEYRKTVEALGAAAADKAANAIDAINEAERMSNTNIAPATTFGWLQVQLRSL
ncbi:MAG: AAA family ATPase [Candidatus Eremiobacteraeota bacterium]|nr:AAA family ATPase [Candidatus Eremiobacteraeota bacterium]